MRELLPEIERWRQAGKRVALATLVHVSGSGLRTLGSKMAISSAGDIAGSVSGGCVEGAVFEETREVIKLGTPKLLEYGIADEPAWEIGLACGGEIQVFVEHLPDESYAALKRCLDAGQLVALATVVAGPGVGNKLLIWPDAHTQGDLGSAELNERVLGCADERLASHDPGRATLNLEGEPVEIFIDVFPPLPRLIVVGAVHIAIPLVTFAKVLGFRTFVIDARLAFATRARFPHTAELIVEWPSTAMEKLELDEASYVVIVSHDDKLDIPALQVALASPARYVGILGSRKTHAKRVQALKQLGLTDEQLARIHAPIGLKLGATSPEEIALSIMAEVVAVRHGAGSRQPKPMRNDD
jgi:xanthine dehydrogenase accessory factor